MSMNNLLFRGKPVSESGTCLINAFGAMGATVVGKPNTTLNANIVLMKKSMEDGKNKIITIDAKNDIKTEEARNHWASEIQEVAQSETMSQESQKAVEIALSLFNDGNYEMANEQFIMALLKNQSVGAFKAKLERGGFDAPYLSNVKSEGFYAYSKQ